MWCHFFLRNHLQFHFVKFSSFSSCCLAPVTPLWLAFSFQYDIKCKAFVDKYEDRNVLVQHVALPLIASCLRYYFYALEMLWEQSMSARSSFIPPWTHFHKCSGKIEHFFKKSVIEMTDGIKRTGWWQMPFGVRGQLSLVVLENRLYCYQSLQGSNASE